MKLSEILAISGQPGLYKYVAQGGKGIIVESLIDKRRISISATAKVSSLGEIAIFTEGEDIALGELFDNIFEYTKGEKGIDPKKSTSDQVKEFFGAARPDYDSDRVHVSDMKKAIAWFNQLVAEGMTEFTEEEEAEEAEGDEAKKATLSKKTMPKDTKPVAAPKSTPRTSGSAAIKAPKVRTKI